MNEDLQDRVREPAQEAGDDATLTAPPDSHPESSHRLAADAVPERIGPYRILRKLGEGGMGEIYEAEQEQPIRRPVALKLIKRGMDSREILARFESERQALALMNHPAIAHVYDAGMTDDGRPFFAMELVAGCPITEHCDRGRLDTRERLELFRRVCDGVQHAHQKGILHRDLKPSNVLVTVEDGEPIPKIIDFGIAKATTSPLTGRSLHTEVGQWLGTPEYMSPEQADPMGFDIDTRSDVYSLGVMLYELLVGLRPFELRRTRLEEVLRRIREEEPPRPSTRFSRLGETSARVARNRRSDPPNLTRRLRGDLDWITMKALAKERPRRYGSPAELAEDLRRHLEHEPVVAGPPSFAYRLGKFVRRNRTGSIAAALILLALLAGVAGTTVGLVRARHEAEINRKVSELLMGIFEGVDPRDPREGTLTARQILDRGVADLHDELTDEPRLRARLLVAIARAYYRLGHFDDVGPLLDQALELQRSVPGGDPAGEASARAELGWVSLSDGDYELARAHFQASLDLRQEILKSDDPALATSLHGLGRSLVKLGRFAEAEPLYRRAREILDRGPGPRPASLPQVIYAQGVLQRAIGRYPESRQLLEQALEMQEETLGPEHSAVGWTSSELAAVLLALDDIPTARRFSERAVAIQERNLGSEHPDVGGALRRLANVLRVAGEYPAAREALERALGIQQRALGHDHPAVADIIFAFGRMERDAGELEAARWRFSDALRAHEEIFGRDHTQVAAVLNELAEIHLRLGDPEVAAGLAERSLRITAAAQGEDHLYLAHPLQILGKVRLVQGDHDSARRHFEDCLAIQERHLESDDRRFAWTFDSLGRLELAEGDWRRARELFARSISIREEVYGPEHLRTAESLILMADVEARHGEVDQARELYGRVLSIRRAHLPAGHPDLEQAVERAAGVLSP